MPNSRFALHSLPLPNSRFVRYFAFDSWFMRLFQAPLDTCLGSPFFASLSVHGLHFTVYAPSRYQNQSFSGVLSGPFPPTLVPSFFPPLSPSDPATSLTPSPSSPPFIPVS